MSYDKKFEKFNLVLGSNIKKYRDLKNFSLQELSDLVGVSTKTIHRYEKGEGKIPSDTLELIAKSLNSSLKQLMEGAFEEIENEEEESENISLPIVGRISLGSSGLAFDDVEGFEQTPRTWINGGEYFYLRAKGDSMNGARIYEGDLLLIRKQEEVEEGEIAVVLIDDEAVLKKVYEKNGMMVLQSANPEYSPIICTPDSNIKIIGKLIKIVINL